MCIVLQAVLLPGHSPSWRGNGVYCVTFCCLFLVLLVILAVRGCSEPTNIPLIQSTGWKEGRLPQGHFGLFKRATLSEELI